MNWESRIDIYTHYHVSNSCSKWCYFVLFYGWATFYCVNAPQYLYSFLCQWAFRLLHVLVTVNVLNWTLGCMCCFKLCFLWVYVQEWNCGVICQFSSVQSLSRVRLCDPMNRSTPGLPVPHRLLEFTQTHVHWVSDAIQPSHRLSSPSPPALNPSQHQSLFQWVNPSHEVAKGLEFQL